MTPERMRLLRRVLGYVGFGLFSFTAALFIFFPYDRAKDRVIAVLAGQNLDVEIGSAGPTLGVGIAFKDIAVRTRPSAAGAKPTRFFVDWARVRFSPLAALFGGSGMDLSATAFGGRIDYDRTVGKDQARVRGRLREIGLGDVPGVKEAINLPLGGSLDATLDVTAPNGRYGEANGFLEWKCSDCVLGDGKAKLKIAGNPLLAEGLSLPAIRLGEFGGRVAVDKGIAKLQGVQAHSPDGDVLIEGEITLRDPLPASTFRAYVRFKLSDALLAGSDKVKLLLQIAENLGKRPDGYFGLRLSGRFDTFDPPEWNKISPFGSSPAPTLGRPGGGGRPGITTVRPGAIGPTPLGGAREALQLPSNEAPAAPSITTVTPPPAPSPSEETAGRIAAPMIGGPPSVVLGEGPKHTLPVPPQPPVQGDPRTNAEKLSAEKEKAAVEKTPEEEEDK